MVVPHSVAAAINPCCQMLAERSTGTGIAVFDVSWAVRVVPTPGSSLTALPAPRAHQ